MKKTINFKEASANLKNVDFAEIVTNCMYKCPWMSGGFASAKMDLLTGQIYYEIGVGSTWTEFDNPTIELYSCNNINTMEGYNAEDLLDEDEFPENDSDTWDVIREHPELRERMIEASLQFFNVDSFACSAAFQTLEEMKHEFEMYQP